MEPVKSSWTPARSESDESTQNLLSVLQVQANLQRDQTLNTLSAARRIEEAMTALRQQTRALFGTEKYEMWRTFMAERRRKLRDERTQLTSRSHAPTTSSSESNRREALTFLGNLGVSVDKLRKLNHVALETYLSLTAAPAVSPGAEVSTGAPRLGGFVSFGPPYADAACSVTSEWFRGFWKAAYVPDSWADRNSGLVGNINYVCDFDAGDYDYGIYDYAAYVIVRYKMPRAGLLGVHLDAQVGRCDHAISLEDESGFSDAYARQNCFFFMQAIGSAQPANVVRATASDFSQTGTDLATSYQLEPVSTYRPHLYSDVPFAKDEWVYIRAGIETHNSCFANDVRVSSSIYARWYLRSILVGPAS